MFGLVPDAEIHPIAVLSALTTYAARRGARGQHRWKPVAKVVDALDAAFYATFSNVEPCGKPVLLALDVSGSMDGSMVAPAYERGEIVEIATYNRHDVRATSAVYRRVRDHVLRYRADWSGPK